MNYHNKTFKPVSVSVNGEVSDETIFVYQQEGDVLSCSYSGGKIVTGHLIGKVDSAGGIVMSYHQINQEGIIQTGTCISKPEVQPNGKIRLHEKWKWTSGDLSAGESILEEV